MSLLVHTNSRYTGGWTTSGRNGGQYRQVAAKAYDVLSARVALRDDHHYGLQTMKMEISDDVVAPGLSNVQKTWKTLRNRKILKKPTISKVKGCGRTW
jgi:hypothetical protein